MGMENYAEKERGKTNKSRVKLKDKARKEEERRARKMETNGGKENIEREYFLKQEHASEQSKIVRQQNSKNKKEKEGKESRKRV